MKHRTLLVVGAASVSVGLALFACVGDAVTPPSADAGIDAAADVAKGDAEGGATPLLDCQAGETLETFEDPMNQSGNLDLCSLGACDQAVTNGVSYSAGTFKAAVTNTLGGAAFSARAHEAVGNPRATEGLVTFELTIDQLTSADAGWQSLGCLLDLSELNDAGALTFISRVEVASNGSGGVAYTYANGNRAAGTSAPLTGFTTAGPMTITLHVDHRTVSKATVSLSSAGGSGTVNLNPTNATRLGMACGAGREGIGVNKVTVKKIRYARCMKP